MPVNEIIKTIKAYETIIIHRHERPDPDAYGSQVGLKEIIKTSYPNKNIYAVGAEDPSLHFLARMDVIGDEQYEQALVIVCDTANTERIDDQRYKLAKKVIKIDHHPNRDQYGDLLWVDTSASSTSEMIYELFLQGKESDLQMSDQAARLIYAGIVGDTGRFLFPSTTKKTFEYATDLVTYDFDRSEIYDGMYVINDNIARLIGYVLQNFTLSDAGVSTMRLTKETLDRFNISSLESGKVISAIAEVKGLKAWAFFIEESKELIRVRLRSKGPVINEIAAKYNGGGHPLAAGATVHSWEETDMIARDLEELCSNYK